MRVNTMSSNDTGRNTQFAGFLFPSLLFALFLILATGCDDHDDQAQPSDNFEIGMLLPLTGSAASAGESVEAGLMLAMVDFNANMAATGDPLRIETTFRDTETNPQTALAQLEDLYNQGIRHVIGPYSSANCAAVGLCQYP